MLLWEGVKGKVGIGILKMWPSDKEKNVARGQECGMEEGSG